MGIFNKEKKEEGAEPTEPVEGTPAAEAPAEAPKEEPKKTDARDRTAKASGVAEADKKAALSKEYGGMRINVYQDGKGFRWKVAELGEPKEVAVSAKESCFAAQREIDKVLRMK